MSEWYSLGSGYIQNRLNRYVLLLPRLASLALHCVFISPNAVLHIIIHLLLVDFSPFSL